MVVKIPVLVNRAKAAVSDEIIETPGANRTEITPEKKNEMAAVAAENKATTAVNNTFTYHELIQRHFPRHQSKSNANDDSNIGDNSSISSRSSMNSMHNTLDRGEANPTSYVAALKAAAAASTRPSSEDAATVSSPSDHSREHIDHSYASPESLQLDDEPQPQPYQNLNTSRSLSFVLPPRPSSPDNSLDWQFSGNMESFFEENDRTAGLSAEQEAENENTDACPLERCQLESFDSAERKLLLRESSNAGGSGTSSSTHKITNRSSDRMPMPSPSGQVGTPPAPPSIGDIFSPGTKGSTPGIVLPKRKSNMFGPPCEPSPSGLFLNIPATNSFSDLLTTSNDNEDRPKTVEPTADQVTKAGNDKETELRKKESDESDKPQYNDIMNTLKDAEEIELQPPAPLGSDHVEGPRRFIIDGAMKTCTNYGIDQISSIGTDGSCYHFLQALSPAFEGCTFLLPWLRQSETKVKVNVSLLGGFKLSQGTLIRPMQAGPSPKDLAKAKRRIQSTICAFGGSINSKKENEDDAIVEKFVTFTKDTSKSSIFRSRSCSPSSTSSSKSAGQKRKREIKSIMRREKYEETLRDQYFENGDRLSWDVQHSLKLSLSGAKTFDEEDNSDTSSSKQDDAEADIVASADIEVEKRPIRYKCTLCGALKRKHVCANRPTILRSIGVNVYPAVNAYTADEPGELATPLSQMNNFIPLSNRNSCQQTTDEEVEKMKAKQSTQIQATSITPDNNPVINLMFRPTMEITSGQYLDVKAEPTARDYLYPDVPLTSGQRKSMSDALLSMSRSVPQLTHACAMVLKDARKGNKWDQAVAELMAQVLCILKCSLTKDYSLDGLRRYLLEVGVSC